MQRVSPRSCRSPSPCCTHGAGGPHETFHGFKGKPLFRIDYVFATPDVKVLDHATFDDAPGGFASDHYPVAATVVLPPPR